MKPQKNQPQDQDTDDIINKDNTEEHNKDHTNLLRPKAGILNQARRRPHNTELHHTIENLVINTLLKLKSSGLLRTSFQTIGQRISAFIKGRG